MPKILIHGIQLYCEAHGDGPPMLFICVLFIFEAGDTGG